MKIEQFVMAYGVEQDRLRAILPEGFASLRPVLRINGGAGTAQRAIWSSIPQWRKTVSGAG